MIYFPPIQTGRLNVQLRELTMQEAVDLAATPLDRHEAALSALLERIVDKASGPNTVPARWTVQERTYILTHYMACTTEESRNFAVGDDGASFLDYLDADLDAGPEFVEAGEACNEQWVARQLNGAQAEALESMCTTRLEWTATDMAARMFEVGNSDGMPDAVESPGEYAQWLKARSALFREFPESDFSDLHAAYLRGLSGLHHLFTLDFDESGHIVIPRSGKGGGAALAPARFLVASCIGTLARILGPRSG